MKINSIVFLLIFGVVTLGARESRSRDSIVDDGNAMIVITAPAYKNALTPFIQWKNQKGIKTTVYEYPAQTGGSGVEAIKTFIQGKYASDGITYVLLVGDAEDVPSIEANGALSDPSFTKVAGNDDYPDLFVGRFSVNSEQEAAVMVNKALIYEKSPDPSGVWYQKAVTVSADSVLMENISTDFLQPYGYSVTNFYGQNESETELIAALNQGCGWFNVITTLGAKSQFSVPNITVSISDLTSLTNTNKYPMLISTAGNNGEFDGIGDCIAEASTATDSTGCMAFFGFTNPPAWTAPPYGLKEMVRLLASDVCISLGGIFYNSSLKLFGLSQFKYADTFNSWTLFGDPSLMFFTKTPKAVNVTCPQNLPSGAQKITITFGENITGRICLYSEKSGILDSRLFKNASSADLYVTVPDNEPVMLTVTGFNRLPFIKEYKPLSIVNSNDLTCPLRFDARFVPGKGTAGVVYFTVKAPDAKKRLSVYNCLGTLVYEDTDNDLNPWRLTIQSRGVYFALLELQYRDKTVRLNKTIFVVR